MAHDGERSTLGPGLRLLGRAIREKPRIFAVGAIGGCAFGLLTIGGALVIGQVVGRVVVPAFDQHRMAPGAIGLGVAAILAVSILRVAAIFGRRLGAGTMQFRLQADYRARVTRRYLELPPAWHRRHATGTLLSNANSDVEAMFFPIAPLPFAVGTTVMLLGAVIALLATDWTFALVGLAVFPGLYAVNLAYSRRMSPRIAKAQALRAQTSALAHESFDGALVVKAMGREQDEADRFAVRAAELRDAMIRVGRVRGVFDPMLDLLPNLGTLAVLVVGVVRLRQGAVDVSAVVGASFLFTVLAVPVRTIGFVLTELPRSVVGWERVKGVLTATGEMPYGEAEIVGTGAIALRMRVVGFSYAPGAEADGRSASSRAEVLSDVSFDVPAGQTVALVGATGSGKSTVASLAVRLVDPERGTVELDGVDVRDLSAAGLAAAVALVPQIPFLFDDTVRGNVTLDRPGVDDEALRGALRRAQADGFVDRLPSRVDTTVGERGASLSGGQRQRVTLARALAGSPRLLVLDDATSAVDPRVEAAILAGLRRSGCSILVVAYRRATIALADEVVYLERGRVVARGPHTVLLDTVEGYANLVRAYEREDAEHFGASAEGSASDRHAAEQDHDLSEEVELV
jgi:ABC-type multidrug transport system fused ATPase/permease subunit